MSKQWSNATVDTDIALELDELVRHTTTLEKLAAIQLAQVVCLALLREQVSPKGVQLAHEARTHVGNQCAGTLQVVAQLNDAASNLGGTRACQRGRVVQALTKLGSYLVVRRWRRCDDGTRWRHNDSRLLFASKHEQLALELSDTRVRVVVFALVDLQRRGLVVDHTLHIGEELEGGD